MGPDDGGDAGPGLVACQLTLAAAAARPGETVTALLQVSCSEPEAVELQEVEVEFTGIERVDTSWVQPSYRQATPPINSDKRKVQRHVVQSRLQAATQGTFSDLSLRRFVVRFTLPAWLPPTFRGTAVRYVYYLQAVVRYRPSAPPHGNASGSDAGSGPANGGAAPAAASRAVASRAHLHIWPLKADVGAERGPGPLGGSVPPSPAPRSEDVPIKCWEIGPGTAVQDAVAHIARLASQAPQLARPHSPGGSLRPAGALPGGGRSSSACGDDSRSEISHEQEDGQGAAQASPGGGAVPTPATQPAAPAAAQDAQRNGGVAPPPTPASSSASTPRSEVPARRAAAARPSLEAAPRSPAHAAADSGSQLRSYALRIGDQPLVRVSLHPPLEGRLQPGSTLAGTMDFTHPAAPGGLPPGSEAADAPAPAAAAVPSPRCMQVLVLLETEEAVEVAWRRPVRGGGGGAVRRVHDEHLEVTADTACTHFLFTIPPDAAASFHTPLVSLRWLLRFQFTARREEAQGRLEQLTWALPVTVLPPPT